MNVHFIAIGGSAMHNLAIALHKKGLKVTGSDDEVFEPSRGRLAEHGLLPASEGWDPKRITQKLDAVILGMHARVDNPELKRAQELGLRIYSYPEYIYEQTKDKVRVVIGGSHGKTSITAMILHVLKYHKVNCDYMVGAQLEGFDTMVRLTDSARFAVLEGDEYLSSPIDRRPKFHVYKANIGLLSGIAWDHINVFPTFEEYLDQFRIFIENIPFTGGLIYCADDLQLGRLVKEIKKKFMRIPYTAPPYLVEDGITSLIHGSERVPLQIFGQHNLQNLEGARMICSQLGISYDRFYDAIRSFSGASNRLELVASDKDTAIYKDFAHSPSKLMATTRALKEQYPSRELVACMELHTFSSLNQEFLQEYKGSMDAADQSIVYFNPHTIAHKKLPPITEEQVRTAFKNNGILVYTDSDELIKNLKQQNWKNRNLLMMSSGNFDGVDLNQFAESLV